jgi:hypothetical protein
MIFEAQATLRERIEELTGRRIYGAVEVFEDTSSYMAICGGSVLRLAGNDYFVMGDTREGRFGIEEQPKFWVKYAVDLTTGQGKIIKLVFHEQFTTTIANFKIQCRRSPEKESAFLEAVRGQPHFMQGVSVTDPVGNLVRIVDFVRGPSLFNYLADLDLPHEQYFHEMLPEVMRKTIGVIEAMARVHERGLHHGDIRNDHLLVEAGTGTFVWIDFDYEVNFTDYDVWCMGNVINYVVGKGMHTFHAIARNPQAYPHLRGSLDESDAVVLYRNRLANLGRLFPYIPAELNDILLRFSVGTTSFYESLDEQVRDLRTVLSF